MTSLNFLLTRALGRTPSRGRDRPHTARPRRERLTVARARRGPRRRRPLRRRRTTSRSTSTTSRRSSAPARGVAFPVASNAVGTKPDVARTSSSRARRRRAGVGGRGSLRTARSDRRGGLGRRRAPLLALQVLRAAPGAAFGKREFLEGLRPYKVRLSDEPVGNRFQDAAARAARRLRRRGRLRRVARLGRDRRARDAARTALPRRPAEGGALRRTMEGRVPTFAFNLPGRTSEEVAIELAEREIAVCRGDYYAVEIMRLLGLEGTGAVRAGIVHYNTAAEVDCSQRSRSSLDSRRAPAGADPVRHDEPAGQRDRLHRVRPRAAGSGRLRDGDLREGPVPAEPRQRLSGGDAAPLPSRGTSTSSRRRGRTGGTRPSRAGSRTTASGVAAPST